MKRKIIIITTIILISCLCVVITNFNRLSPQPVQEKGQSSHQSIPTFTDQQLGILVGLVTSPEWLKQNIASNQLVYGIVKSSDTAPAGVDSYSYLVAADNQDGTVIFFKEEKRNYKVYFSTEYKTKIKEITFITIR